MILMTEARLNYEWLMDLVAKGEEQFLVADWGCGMKRYRSFGFGNKGLIMVNEVKREAHILVYPNGELAEITADDIDMESIGKTGYSYDVEKLKVSYRFEVERYRNGIAMVSWMLHPDGSYYMDEDRYGCQDDEEVWVYAYIDTDCQVLVKFQQMESKQIKEKLFEEALQNRVAFVVH